MLRELLAEVKANLRFRDHRHGGEVKRVEGLAFRQRDKTFAAEHHARKKGSSFSIPQLYCH